MIELPKCRWRGEETIVGHHECSSAKLSHGPNGVRDELCSTCHLRDHKPESSQQPEDLSFIQRIAYFAYAMKVELAWRAKGRAIPTEEEKAVRRSHCDPCSDRDADSDICNLCGCYLEAGLLPPRPLGKLDCATQSCPKGLWGYTGGYKPPKNKGCCNKKG